MKFEKINQYLLKWYEGNLYWEESEIEREKGKWVSIYFCVLVEIHGERL